MTLTKYQQGVPVEGWNDCPPQMLGTKMRKKRTPRPQVGIITGTEERYPSASPTAAPVTPPISAPPTPTPPASTIPSRSTSLSSTNATSTPTATPTATPVLSRRPSGAISIANGTATSEKPCYDDFFSHTFDLPEKELSHYKARLTAAAYTANDVAFVTSILSRIDSDTVPLKKEILNYMVVHSGVSSWCSPLKKLIEAKA